MGGNDDRGLDGPDESATSFGSLPPPKPVKYAWAPANDRVNHENFHRMLEEYRACKKRERDLELKIKQLGAQLARTEEAAKRALVQTDATAKGGAAQKLLDAERAIAKLRAENAELASKLAREKKRSSDLKAMADTYKHRLDGFLRDQRNLVQKVGQLERTAAASRRKPEDEFWGEEAGRRFVAQQEELVALKEENTALKELMESDGPLAQCKAYEGQINELQNLVKFYERKITAMAEAGMGGLEALGGPGNQPGPDDWVLEEFWHNDEMYLLDRKTGKMFTVPGDNNFPRPLGIRTNKEVKMGIHNSMERFLATLDSFLASNGARLQEVFAQFDVDNSGQLDRRELARLLQTLMPDLNQTQIEELRMMLDVDGDGLISLPEMLESIKEAFAARTAAKVGKNIEVNDALDRIREVLRENKQEVRASFDELDSDKDGCLSHLEVVRLVRRFLKDMYQKEVRYLLAKLQQWDVQGESKVSFDELYQCLELVRVFRVGPGLGGAMRTGSPMRSPTRSASPSKMPTAGPNIRASGPGRASLVRSTVGGGGMKEAFMRERVGQLEAELRDAQRRNSELEDDAKKVELLQRDAALYKARIEELERDFMKIDVLGNLEAAGGDEQLQKAWEIASTFKKRFMEHKGELDNIRILYARMQAQLDETHKLLHEEHRKRFKLEDEITRLNVELMRVQDLESRLTHEKGERVKLEREYLTLQQKALNAPGEALAEVRALREELFAVKREKATAQQKEAEVRMELQHVRTLLDGMDQTSYKAMQDDSDALKKKVASLSLELQAARDKLAVYMRTELPGGAANTDLLFADDDLLFGSDRKPDSDKTPEELRRELIQLRDVWRLDQGEIKKLHKVLETESAITMEAKAAVEEAHREMERVKRELQADLRKLEREIERRDEKIRKLELQLRGAYSGINRALRSSKRGGLRDSIRSDADDLSELGEDQNIFELHVTEAQIYEEALGKDPAVFFTFDFFMHESQATPIVSSNAPSFNTVIQYVVDSDPFLLDYLDTHVLELELCRARGYDYDVLGVARFSLKQVLEDLEIGAALGYNRAYHYADVFGADGKRLGRLRYGYCFRRPLDALLKEWRVASRHKRRSSEPDERDPATAAVQQALTQPGNSQAVKVIIERCDGLVPAGGTALTMRPYVYYRFPGHRDYRDTQTLAGAHPVFNDEAVWPIARTPALEADLRTRHLQLVVFDDSQSDDPLRAIVGVASVPLAGLAQGVPVEGAFKLTNPVTRQPAGRLVLGLGWHNPLQLPGAVPKPPPPRVPISSEPLEGGPTPDFGLGAGVQELFPVGGGVRPGGFGPGGPGHPLPRPSPAGGQGATFYAQPQPGVQPPQPGGARLYQGQQPYEAHGLAAELGGNNGGRPGGRVSEYGLAADTRQGAPAPMQPPYGPHGGGGAYGGGPGAPGSGFGLAAEAAARQPPAHMGIHGQQQLQQGLYEPSSQYGGGQQPYGGGPGQQRVSDYGLAADTRDQYGAQGPYGPGGVGGGIGGLPGQGQGLYGGPAPGQSPLRPGGRPPLQPQQQQQEFGLGAEAAAAGYGMGAHPPPAGGMQRQGSFGRPPPGPLGGGVGSRLGGPAGGGGLRPPSDAAYGMQAETGAGYPPRPGQPPLRQGSFGAGGGGGGEEFGLGAEVDVAASPPPPGNMMLPPSRGPGGGGAGGRTRYGADTELSLEQQQLPVGPDTATLQHAYHPAQQMSALLPPAAPAPPANAGLGPVLRRERPELSAWMGREYRILFCLHSIELTQQTLRNPNVSAVVVCHSLLEEGEAAGNGISMLDTYSKPLAKAPGQLPINYCVAYNILAGNAASELYAGLTGPGGADFSLELSLMYTSGGVAEAAAALAPAGGSGSEVAPGMFRVLGGAALPLAELWTRRRGDLIMERVEVLEDADDPGSVVAVLSVSLVAEAALATLRETMRHRGGAGGGVPY
ncbi:hypothetical protein HYH02_007017 [Chlamydomonas schloesseri]|uniref:C2 domain-containing protein n=1 Tax=Chlamydomonas schloesseri TaxID=2026947 RepID=A0A835WI16_9CHLO|nr:hypothetical protein HYH02_007017 [Chlamydomonas schloesseri]|eukprot:KAG2447989.1 hypothetical protein HYH02_007017 [Chlamydomonas schloesseri]